MKGKYIMVLEVSQKQSYIFNEKKLRKNIEASNVIAYVTSPLFFEREFGDLYNEVDNLIYAGGGHTLLVFNDRGSAEAFSKRVSRHVLERLPSLELFIKIREYDDRLSPSKNIAALLGVAGLEKKKGIRSASFYQHTFGLERSGRRISIGPENGEFDHVDDAYRERISHVVKNASSFQDRDADGCGLPFVDIEKCPEGYYFTDVLEDIGCPEGKNNFIAVVHIDGNQMGSRVQKLGGIIEKHVNDPAERDPLIKKGYSEERIRFEIWRKYSRLFSESVDMDYKRAMCGLYQDLKYNLDLKHGISDSLSLKEKGGRRVFPLRKIIAAGDDICFVTTGSLGLECAARFIEHLSKQKNVVDGDENPYAACAGVAIVHQKYPFYRAYELAEQLCSNAKKVMAARITNANKNGSAQQLCSNGKKEMAARVIDTNGNGSAEQLCSNGKKEMAGRVIDINGNGSDEQLSEGCLSAIDWHVEYGELAGELDDIRDAMRDEQGNVIYGRPYQITSQNISPTLYSFFREYVCSVRSHFYDDSYARKGKYSLLPVKIARNKLKKMRETIKQSPQLQERYSKVNFISEILPDGITNQEIFDLLEIMDMFLPLAEEG